MINIITIIILLGILTFVVAIIVKDSKRGNKNSEKRHLSTDKISEISFQKYAKFFEMLIPKDPNFNKKINNLYNIVTTGKETDINIIAEKIDVDVSQCILMIKYLMNKRQLEKYYFNIEKLIIKRIPEELEEKVNKYKPFIYNSFLQIEEMIKLIPELKSVEVEEAKRLIYNDLVFLYNNNLINGLKINTKTKEIIYYSLEKKKVDKNISTVICPHCGALNDLELNQKDSCVFCKKIIEETKANKI